jgi:ribosome maturation factor RimP
MAGIIEDKVREVAQPLIDSMGLKLWGIRFRGGRDHAVLQIFVEGENGVDADSCGQLADLLSPALDVADPIGSAYTLEVSSPGMDRLLFTKEQASAYVGSVVKAELRMAQEGRKRLKGELTGVSADGLVTIAEEGAGPCEVAFSNIAALRLVPSFNDGGAKAPKNKRS